MAIPINTTSGVVYLTGWSGTISGTSLTLSGTLTAGVQVVSKASSGAVPAFSFAGLLTDGFSGDGSEVSTYLGGTKYFAIRGNRVILYGGTAQLLEWSGSSKIGASADGKFDLTNNGATAGVLLDLTTDATAYFKTRAGADTAIVKAATLTATAAGSVSVATINPGTQTNTGFFAPNATSIGMTINGVSHVNYDGNFAVANGDRFYWSSTAAATGSGDVSLRRSGTKALYIDTDGAAGALNSVTFAATTVGVSANFNVGSNLTFSATTPTFTSGFGGATGRTITGTCAAFSIVIGSTSTDNNGVLGLPTAANGWVVRAENQTSPGATDIKQSASTTASVTLTQYNTTLGTAANFAAGDIIKGTAIAY